MLLSLFIKNSLYYLIKIVLLLLYGEANGRRLEASWSQSIRYAPAIRGLFRLFFWILYVR
jgi:hypothetical protein